MGSLQPTAIRSRVYRTWCFVLPASEDVFRKLLPGKIYKIRKCFAVVPVNFRLENQILLRQGNLSITLRKCTWLCSTCETCFTDMHALRRGADVRRERVGSCQEASVTGVITRSLDIIQTRDWLHVSSRRSTLHGLHLFQIGLFVTTWAPCIFHSFILYCMGSMYLS